MKALNVLPKWPEAKRGDSQDPSRQVPQGLWHSNVLPGLLGNRLWLCVCEQGHLCLSSALLPKVFIWRLLKGIHTSSPSTSGDVLAFQHEIVGFRVETQQGCDPLLWHRASVWADTLNLIHKALMDLVDKENRFNYKAQFSFKNTL